MTRYESLYDAMVNHQRDFTLVEIYRILCRPPHLRDPSVDELHSRCARGIQKARALAESAGYEIVHGEARHSYRARRKPRTR